MHSYHSMSVVVTKVLKVYCTLQSAEGRYRKKLNIKKLKIDVTSSLRISCIMYNHNEVAMCCIMYQVGYVVSRTTRTADADEGVGGF